MDKQGFLIPNLCEVQALFVLVLVSQLLVSALTLFQFGFDVSLVTFAQITLYVQWQALLSAFLLCRLKNYLAHIQKNRAAILAFSLLSALGFVMAVIAERVTIIEIMDWELVARNTIISAIIAGISLRYLYVQQQVITREKAELKANLLALQARIRPHFLFNSLNSIASLVSFAPEKAEVMIEDLAALIRASLKEDIIETSIKDEWQLCQHYLDIEKVRLGDRLSWECDFEELDMNAPILGLCLQPLIENALYHGIQPNPDPGLVKIKGRSQGNAVTIEIENTQSKEHQGNRSNKGNNMAIKNIRDRLENLYGQKAKLTLNDLGDRYNVVLHYQYQDASD